MTGVDEQRSEAGIQTPHAGCFCFEVWLPASRDQVA
jgi:hypothetical protein